jgi:hypothetical protein
MELAKLLVSLRTGPAGPIIRINLGAAAHVLARLSLYSGIRALWRPPGRQRRLV